MKSPPDPLAREEAAYQIWARYSSRLIALARQKLDGRVRRREDEEDVLQDVFQSLCRRLEVAEPLRDRDDLWRLMFRITVCKSINSINRNLAGCRDVRRERPDPAGDADRGGFPGWALEYMDRSEPTPDDAAALNEGLQRRLGGLPEDLRRVALLKLEGYTNEEIAGRIGRTVRSVEVKLHLIRKRWEADAD